MLHNVVAWNAVFATAQLALAAGLPCRLAVKAALAATIVWSVAVWWLGESLGGIFTGAASPLSGAPGAVILYALVAILAWPSHSGDRRHATVADGSPFGAVVTGSVDSAVGEFCLPDGAGPKPGTRCLARQHRGLAAGEPHGSLRWTGSPPARLGARNAPSRSCWLVRSRRLVSPSSFPPDMSMASSGAGTR